MTRRAGTVLLWCLVHPGRVLVVPALWVAAGVAVVALSRKADEALESW